MLRIELHACLHVVKDDLSLDEGQFFQIVCGLRVQITYSFPDIDIDSHDATGVPLCVAFASLQLFTVLGFFRTIRTESHVRFEAENSLVVTED